jgi:chromosome segregation protein
LEGLRNNLADETRKLDAKKNEHDLLKSLVDSLEGYPESVKFLHKNNGWNHQAPLLSDIIYVKDDYRADITDIKNMFNRILDKMDTKADK